ncbi:MAG: sensor histidine kinase [Saprospiraceae bacterium]
MKFSKKYLPYVCSLIMTIYGVANNHDLSFQPRTILVFIDAFISFVLFWKIIEYLLSISENSFTKWSITFLGIVLYLLFYISLDYYVLHLLHDFFSWGPFRFGIKLFVVSMVFATIIESHKWGKAKEKTKIENLQLQAENIEFQYNLLLQQVKPDFLFRCLNTLRHIVKKNDPNAEAYILKLADVYRQNLNKERAPITLREELSFSQSFFYLMAYGKENAVTLDCEISDESLDFHLPSFSIQLLLENCLKYNYYLAASPLKIRVFQKELKSITVCNNLQPEDSKGQEDDDGIESLQERYLYVGIHDAVLVEQNKSIFSTTIKLF